MSKRGLLFLIVFVALGALIFVVFRSNTHTDSGAQNVARPEETSQSKAKIQQPQPQEMIKETKNPQEQSTEDDKLKPLSIEKQVSLIEKRYPSVLNQKGFTEHESEVIVRMQVEDMRANQKAPVSAIDRAVKELQLSEEKKSLLNEAFDETFLHLIDFTVDDIAACLGKRLSGSSECTKSVLDDFIKDLSQSLETDVFVHTRKVTLATQAAVKKAVDVCKETPERAKSQFRLVFVECDPI